MATRQSRLRGEAAAPIPFSHHTWSWGITAVYYAIICEDADNSLPLRKQTRPAHLARLQPLADAGRVLVAGPHPAVDTNSPGEAGFSGSLMVVEFDSLAEAEAWAEADPYVEAGVFRKITVKPLVPVQL